MPTVTLSDGATIWFEKRGAGAPVLQIHGSAFGHRNFEKLTPYLTDHVEVIDFDLPGYGDSHGGPPARNFGDFAAQVAELIPALGYERVHVNGTSFGAMIALTLAVEHPQVVEKLALSCFVARYDNAARMMRATWKRAAVDSGMSAVADLTSIAGFARSFHDRPEAQEQLAAMRVAFEKTEPAAFIAATETIERTDLSDLGPKITAPTLLLAGAEDAMTPFRPSASGYGMAELADTITDCRTVVLPESGHYLVIEVPAEAAAEIVAFLRA